MILNLVQETVATIPNWHDPDQHTMGSEVLKDYVFGKFTENQQNLLYNALREEMRVEVHGIYDAHVEEILAEKEYTLNVDSRCARESRKNKDFNNHRPALYKCKDNEGSLLVLTVFPSPDFVNQYAELTLALMKYQRSRLRRNPKPEPDVKVIHYNNYEADVAKWTKFFIEARKFIRAGDICVIGGVEEISNNIDKYNFSDSSGWTDFGIGNIFSYNIHSCPSTHRRLVLVGFRHSFWGSAAGKFSRALVDAGCGHLIYAAKCGVLIDADHIHKLLCPSSFHLLNTAKNNRIDNYSVPSSLRSNYKGMLQKVISGGHLTVPTVVGETFNQQNAYKQLRPATIDNEISYIAKEIYNHNEGKSTLDAQYTALHFTTDYVKEKSTISVFTKGDLSKKGGVVDKYKSKKFEMISIIINNFAHHNGALIDEKVKTRGIVATLSDYGPTFSRLEALGNNEQIIDNRRDIGEVLDGWLASFYLANLDNYIELIRKININKQINPEMFSAIQWAKYACEYSKAVVRDNRGALSRENHPTLEYVIAQGIKSIKEQEEMPKLIRALYYDLVASSLFRMHTNNTNKDTLTDSANNFEETLTLLKDSSPDNAQSTLLIWECYAQKLLGEVLFAQKKNKKAKQQLLSAINGFISIKGDIDPKTQPYAWYTVEGELSLAKLAYLQRFSPPRNGRKWQEEARSFTHNAQNIFPVVRNTVFALTQLKNMKHK